MVQLFNERDKTKERYVYHYHAYFKEGAWETSMDGLLFCDDKILSNDDYDIAKRMIADEVKTTHEIYIDSLSLIGHEPITKEQNGEEDIDKSTKMMYNDHEIKAAFREEFVPPYLERVQETINGRDVAELLYMAFKRGYLNGRN